VDEVGVEVVDGDGVGEGEVVGDRERLVSPVPQGLRWEAVVGGEDGGACGAEEVVHGCGPDGEAGGEAFDLRDGLGYSSDLYRPTISLRLGGTPDPHLRLGGELSAWIDDHGDRTESLSNLLFIGQLYPAASTGLYLKGGLGIARNEVDFDQGFGVGDTGFAGSIGAGWEVRVGKNWFINPGVDLTEQRYTGRGGDRYRERILNFGVNVLFQSAR